jgi:hypothetical protein
MVLRVEPQRLLVLGSPDLARDASSRANPERWGMFGANYAVTWAFVLEPIGDNATRLIVRVRADSKADRRTEIVRPAILAVHRVMQGAQLRNLKRRAESPETGI